MTRTSFGAIVTQITYTTTNNRPHSAVFFIVWFGVALVLAAIPAIIASNKGRSFALFYLFGFFCWLPALIVAIVISNQRAGPPPWGPGPSSWATPPPPPQSAPAGWYPDPGGSASQRYWDGYRWTDHLQ